MNKFWDSLINKRAIIFITFLPIGFWLLSIAVDLSISGINWATGRYCSYTQQGYCGLLIFQKENISFKKNITHLFLPVSRRTPGFDHERFTFRLLGNIEIPQTGFYTIGTESDDGSWIWIDGAEVINNGGIHPRRVLTNHIHLTEGNHLIRIKFENRMLGAFLDFFWLQPDGNKVPLIIKTFDPKVIESILLITDSLRGVAILFHKIAVYWLIFFGALFLYKILFNSHLSHRFLF